MFILRAFNHVVEAQFNNGVTGDPRSRIIKANHIHLRLVYV